jgi:hypothetical protein
VPSPRSRFEGAPEIGGFDEFPIGAVPRPDFVPAHGIDLQAHAGGDLVIDVDRIRAVSTSATPGDCDASGVPDACDIAAGALHDVDRDGVPDECEETVCRRADANDSSDLDITDGIFVLDFLFLGGPGIPAPGIEACGVDPTPDPFPPCDHAAALCP